MGKSSRHRGLLLFAIGWRFRKLSMMCGRQMPPARQGETYNTRNRYMTAIAVYGIMKTLIGLKENLITTYTNGAKILKV